MATLLPLLVASLSAPALPASAGAGDLTRRVVEVLEGSYYDEAFRTNELPRLAAPYLRRAAELDDLGAERALVFDLLTHVPVSHLGLLSARAYETLFAELRRRPHWNFGFQLVELQEGWFVDWVFEGGIADRAGLVRGDQVLALDGLDPARHPRLDWRTDDAALDDPPLHDLLAEPDAHVEVLLRRAEGRVGRVTLPAELRSGWDATRSSARVIERDGLRLGYVHFWFVPMDGAARLLRDLSSGDFAGCDALLLDLRGRGGSADEAFAMLRALDPEHGGWAGPLVALVHADTRSAKEVIAFELQRDGRAVVVGQSTRGAVIPASFVDVGDDSVLMFPGTTLGRHTRAIEGHGVRADVEVDYPLAWTAGADPILAAGVATAVTLCRADGGAR